MFRYLAEHNLVDCIVTSAGGVEEDFIKCFKDTYVGKIKAIFVDPCLEIMHVYRKIII